MKKMTHLCREDMSELENKSETVTSEGGLLHFDDWERNACLIRAAADRAEVAEMVAELDVGWYAQKLVQHAICHGKAGLLEALSRRYAIGIFNEHLAIRSGWPDCIEILRRRHSPGSVWDMADWMVQEGMLSSYARGIEELRRYIDVIRPCVSRADMLSALKFCFLHAMRHDLPDMFETVLDADEYRGTDLPSLLTATYPPSMWWSARILVVSVLRKLLPIDKVDGRSVFNMLFDRKNAEFDILVENGLDLQRHARDIVSGAISVQNIDVVRLCRDRGVRLRHDEAHDCLMKLVNQSKYDDFPLEWIEILLSMGLKMSEYLCGEHAIHRAVYYKCPGMVRTLIKGGANWRSAIDMCIINPRKKTCRMLADLTTCLVEIGVLHERAMCVPRFLDAVMRGNMAEVRENLSQVDLDGPTGYGGLIAACSSGEWEMGSFLLQQGVEWQAMMRWRHCGWLSLHEYVDERARYAYDNDTFFIIRALERMGVDKGALDAREWEKTTKLGTEDA